MKTRCARIASCLAVPLPMRFDKRREYEPACSGVVLYLGLKQRYEHLAHHDFVFSRDPHEEFHHIYDLAEPAPDPTCYLASTSATDPTTAPAGGDALYVLVHTPFLRPKHDWSKMFPAYRQVILNKLKRTAGLTDIEERIVFERALTPVDIHQSLPGAEWSDLRHLQPRPLERRLQTGQCQSRPGGPLPGGRGSTSRAGNAYGDDERLDRRRCARSALSWGGRCRFCAQAGRAASGSCLQG